ncbi:hypothetical protein G7046_g1007 [Stylonectria norvegica]|nr:hypothetical protein G7046_g1007 [Stylonectria norvegica]
MSSHENNNNGGSSGSELPRPGPPDAASDTSGRRIVTLSSRQTENLIEDSMAALRRMAAENPGMGMRITIEVRREPQHTSDSATTSQREPNPTSLRWSDVAHPSAAPGSAASPQAPSRNNAPPSGRQATGEDNGSKYHDYINPRKVKLVANVVVVVVASKEI